MTDHVLESARELVGDSLEELNASIEGLPIEALNWRPTDDANSVAVIATHALGASRVWLRMAMGLPLPERDLDAEFRASAPDADEFGRFVQRMSDDCTRRCSRRTRWTGLRCGRRKTAVATLRRRWRLRTP